MKKLFSYLLISSMVVLSSCTNYDDQFDDLNSQINSLKSQIEGFSSLSSGLTALQGTVSSLQSAVAALPKTATPATDISGLEASVAALQTQLASASTSAEVTAITTQLTAAQTALADAIAANGTASDTNATNIEALQTSLEAVQATLAELKTQLASADTSADVAALTTALATVQTDLAELLAQNNVYTGPLTINSEATLAAAETAGNKLTIVSGAVDITHNATVDKVRLQAVVDKIKTITTDLTYTQSGTGTSPVVFNNLTGVNDMNITQDGAVSFPKLVSAGTIDLIDNTDTAKITSVSFPALTTVTAFETGGTAGVINFADATNVNLASLVRYPGATLGINIDDTSTVALTALTTTDETTGKQKNLGLTVTGPDALTLPLYESGALSTDAEVVTLPKAKAALANGTASHPSFTGKNLTELHIHNLQSALSFNSTDHANLTTLDVIGVATTGTTSAETTYNAQVTVETGTDLKTLTLAGLLKKADITATDLDAVTTSGAIQIAAFKNSTRMTSLTLGHTSKIGAVSFGSLTVSGNTKLTSLSADSLDDISGLVITNNAKLETISFDALNSIGTDVAGKPLSATAGDIQVHTNKLSASNLQLASEEDAAVTVTGKFTSASGMSDLETIIPLIGAKDANAKVQFDALAQITPADGGTPITAAPGYSGASLSVANKNVTWAGANAGIVIYSKTPGNGASPIEARYQRNTNYFTSSLSVGVGSIIEIDLDGADYSETIDGTKYTSLAGYDSTDPTTYMDDVQRYINEKLSDGGESVTVEIANDVFPVYTVKVDALSPSGSTAAGLLSQTGVVTFKVGTSKLITATVGSGAGAYNNTTGLAALVAGMVSAINTNLTTTWKAVAGTGKIELTPQKVYSGTNVAVDDIAFDGTAPTVGSFSTYSALNSNTTALVASQTIAQVGTTTMSKKWRITATNSSLTVKEDNLEIGQTFLLSSAAANTLSFAAITSAQLGSTLSSTDLQLDFKYARARDASGVTAAKSFSIVSFL